MGSSRWFAGPAGKPMRAAVILTGKVAGVARLDQHQQHRGSKERPDVEHVHGVGKDR